MVKLFGVFRRASDWHWRHCALIMLLLLSCVMKAQAHGYVVRAIPADRSTLERPPTRLQYWFSEDLEPRFSAIHLRDQAGELLASGAVDAQNHALLALRMPPNLPDGAYIVELRPAFASDGHVIAESRVFFVGPEVGGVAGRAADERAIPLEVLWRAMLNLAHYLFFGASLLYSAVLLPAWGSDRYPAGNLPPRVLRRLRHCLVAAVLLAFAAGLIALLQQSMVFFNAGAAQVLEQNLWEVVLIGSRFGDVWIFRLLLLIFTAVLLFAAEYYRALMPGLSAGIWRGFPWLGALFIGTSMVTGHAAGSPLLPWVAVAVDWLHVLGVAFWLGGALTLTLLLPIALAPYAAAGRGRALRAVLRRFSRIVAPLLLLVIVTGVYNAGNYIVTPADLASGYGRSLAIKLLLLIPLLVVGAQQHIALRPQLAEGSRWPPRLLDLLDKLGRWTERGVLLRLESSLMLAVLIAVSLLSATPVPEPASLAADIAAPQATQSLGEFSVSAAIIPGGPGVNTFDVALNRNGVAATDATVSMQMVNPGRDRRSPWHPAESVEEGLYVAASDAIDAAGLWWTVIDIIDADGATTRAAFAWDINAEAAAPRGRSPNALHIVTLALIAGLLLALAYRRAQGRLGALNLSPVSALIAAAAVLISLGVMVTGALLIGERQREYERTLNPPPAVVNTALPDAASLSRGETLYRERCLIWQSQSADFRALRNRLNRARDDFLYAAITNGWRDLPACAGDLSASDRWDIVNYFRSLASR